MFKVFIDNTVNISQYGEYHTREEAQAMVNEIKSYGLLAWVS
jgi:hypothetical protein